VHVYALNVGWIKSSEATTLFANNFHTSLE
jgi:hypothetical protein